MVDPRQFIWQVNQTDGLEDDDSMSDPRQMNWRGSSGVSYCASLSV